MLARVLDRDAGPFAPSLRAVLVGGGPIPEPLLARARARGLPVLPTYGLTEAASQVATAAPGDADRPAGSVGRALPGITVRIGAADTEGFGEILVRGPTVMAGYLGRADDTAAGLRNGWLHTGDLGRLDDEGRLTVADRRSDLIVTGGENVYPREVETVLLAHPAVREAAVYGVTDPEWGQRVAAAVVARADATLDGEALRAWCGERLAAFKVPRAIALVAALPRTTGGKLQRRRLRAAADAGPGAEFH
jgi:O-succinylbenzoic acid--CoA ligase